jgi:hypothetical protein
MPYKTIDLQKKHPKRRNTPIAVVNGFNSPPVVVVGS